MINDASKVSVLISTGGAKNRERGNLVGNIFIGLLQVPVALFSSLQEDSGCNPEICR